MAGDNGPDGDAEPQPAANGITDAIANDVERQLQDLTSELVAVDAQLAELQARRHQLVSRRQRLQQQVTEARVAELADGDWESRSFPWTARLETALRQRFGISGGFRAQQLAAINASMSGHDVLLVMPTGGGKSLCYQLPAVAEPGGVTLVVTPLVSLMEDQVLALQRRGVSAEMLSATTTRQEVTRILSAMVDTKSDMCLLYATPEKLAKSKRFMTKLQAMHKLKRFRRLAIDEVHCCSQWGHDFRPDYKFLGVMKGMFPTVPILGLTATCTADVARDVKKMLHVPEAIVFKAPFNRPNLFYDVRQKPSSTAACVEELVQLVGSRYRGQSGIIYTTSVRDTEDLASKLEAAGVKAAPYHAQLPAHIRSGVHRRWLAAKLQVVVATIAFGMGIDKPDVRFVIHHSLSKSLENYYQESGRAGRDGQPADCLLLFRLQDVFTLSAMVFTDAAAGLHNLYTMLGYCVSAARCRRSLIAAHFEERWSAADCAGRCDCCRRAVGCRRADLSRHARSISALLERAAASGQRLTMPRLLEAWLGRGPPALRLAGQPPPNISQKRAETVLAHLLIESYLKEDFHFTPYRTISYVVAGPNDGVYPLYMEEVDPAAAAAADGGAGAKAEEDRNRKPSVKRRSKTAGSKSSAQARPQGSESPSSCPVRSVSPAAAGHGGPESAEAPEVASGADEKASRGARRPAAAAGRSVGKRKRQSSSGSGATSNGGHAVKRGRVTVNSDSNRGSSPAQPGDGSDSDCVLVE